MAGLVLNGINNIFLVQTPRGLVECRIKGKIVKQNGPRNHNVIVAGDRVEYEIDPYHEDRALIVDVLPRQSSFARFNQKSQSMQTIAANFSQILCVSCVDLPRFKPHFIERLLLLSEYFGLNPLILMNKSDLETNDEVADEVLRWKAFWQSLGYGFLEVSCVSGQGLEELKTHLKNTTSLAMGQSGVGKSSLLNALDKTMAQRTEEISRKHKKGRHTTNFACLFPLGWASLIDAPGIRELIFPPMALSELSALFREFRPYESLCAFANCTHLHEPGCAIRAHLGSTISPKRYVLYTQLAREQAHFFQGN